MSVTITDEAVLKTIEKYAEQKGIPKTEAANKLINTAKGRLNAIRKYAKKMAEAPAAKTKKAAKPKSEKKAAKPKAPRVRKAKAEPAVPNPQAPEVEVEVAEA
jgi:hypothetical protein